MKYLENMKPFREFTPQRTYKGQKTNYRDYKPYLAKDFRGRCGYTDCSDVWFGGQNNFHIDHFIPWKGAKTADILKTDYNNLVYCCSYVNILKSNDKGPYSDPCNVDFNELFYRDDMGNIHPFDGSDSAKYMYHKMRLYMARYSIIWMLDQLEVRMRKIAEIIEKRQDENELGILLSNFVKEQLKYKAYLSKSL